MTLKCFCPRFTLIWLVVAVVLAGLTIFDWDLSLRSADYAKRAENHKNMASACWVNRSLVGSGFGGSEPNPSQKISVEQQAEQQVERSALELQARYEEQMAEKYRRASRYPWLFIEPDPPRPPDPPDPEEIRILSKEPFDPNELYEFYNSRYPLHPVEGDPAERKNPPDPK